MSKSVTQLKKHNLAELVNMLEMWPSYGHDLEFSWNGDTKKWEAIFHFVPHNNYIEAGNTLKEALVTLIGNLPDLDATPNSRSTKDE